MIVRIVAALLGIYHGGNGLYMLIAPYRWYQGIAADTGPFNPHFVADIGVAFLAAGLAFLALAVDRRAALLALGASGFLVGHAIIHLIDLGHGAGAIVGVAAIALPALVGVAVAWPRRPVLSLLTKRMLDHFGQRFGYDVGYMHAMLDASPSAFRKFGRATALANHREAVEPAPHFAAKLVGTLGEDCGPCTQIVTDMAYKAGVPVDQIAAVLRGDLVGMSEDVALAYCFARAVLASSPDADGLREQVRALWGDKGVVDLTFALQGSRLYPMVKQGLGFAKECRQVVVDGQPVWTGWQAA